MKNIDLQTHPFEIFDRDWALVTAGTPDHFNTMTISWGGMGTIWHMPVCTIYIRPSRYTFDFLNDTDTFTVSFFEESFKKDLGVLGSLSGRDGDKIAKTALHPVPVGETMGFAEARLTLLCRKVYWQDMDPSRFPAEALKFYPDGNDWHRMYIGEVLATQEK